MAYRELYIGEDEVLIDLGGDTTVIALTMQVHDLSNLQSRNGVRSNKFAVPGTQLNNVALGFANSPKTSSAKPYRKLRAKYVEDGVEIIPDGSAIIEETKGGNYSITLYSGNLDFFNLIEGLKLSDLDLSEYDHDYTFANIRATHTNTTGLKYPLIDYGDLKVPIGAPAPSIDTARFRPAFFIDTLLRKIFSEQDYDVAGDILTRDDYLKLLLLFATESTDTLFESAFGTQIVYEEWTDIDFVINPPNAWVNVFDSIPTGNVDIHTYLRIKITNTDPFAPDKWVKVFIVDYFTGTYTQVGMVSGDGMHSVFGEILNAARGYQYTVFLAIKGCWAEVIEGRLFGESVDDTTNYFFSAGIPRSDVFQTGGTEKYTFAGLEEQLTMYFETYNLQRFAPDMLQKDFLLAIMNIFCLFPVTDPMKREVTLISLEKVVKNKRISRNWTSKMHMEKSTHSGSFRKGTFAQLNYFEYTEDGSDPDKLPNLGRGVLTIDDETLPKEKTLVALPFAATVMVKRYGTLDFALIRMLEDEVFSNAVAPRILVDNTQDTVTSITFEEGANTVSLNTDIPLVYFQLLSKSFNLGFDNSLLEDNYTEFEDMVNRMKILLRLFDLKLLEAVRFDHSVPIYLDQYAMDFYVNKISNFKKGKLTSVELIRI